MVELSGVPHDRRLAAVRLRRVAPEPAEAELDEGIGVRLHRPEDTFVAHIPNVPDSPGVAARMMPALRRTVRCRAHAVGPGCGGSRRRPRRARRRCSARSRCGPGRVPSRRPSARRSIRRPSGRDPVVVHDRLEPHLVIEREDQRHVGAVAVDAELDDFTIVSTSANHTGRHRGLPGDAQHLAPDVGVEPGRDAANVVVGIGHVVPPRKLPDGSRTWHGVRADPGHRRRSIAQIAAPTSGTTERLSLEMMGEILATLGEMRRRMQPSW